MRGDHVLGCDGKHIKTHAFGVQCCKMVKTVGKCFEIAVCLGL